MADVLHVTIRNTRGSREARRLRSSGAIPAVLYGHRFDPVLLSLDERTFKAAMRREKGLHGILNLQVEGEGGIVDGVEALHDSLQDAGGGEGDATCGVGGNRPGVAAEDLQAERLHPLGPCRRQVLVADPPVGGFHQ